MRVWCFYLIWWVGMSCVRSDVIQIDKTWPIIDGKRSDCHCYLEIIQSETAFSINVTFNKDTYDPEFWFGSLISQDINGRWYCVRNSHPEHPPNPINVAIHVSYTGSEPLSGFCHWNLDSDNICYSGINETNSLITPTQFSSDQDQQTEPTQKATPTLRAISSSQSSPVTAMIFSSTYFTSSAYDVIVTSPVIMTPQVISFAPMTSQCYTLTLYMTSTIFLEASPSSHYSLVTVSRTIHSSNVLESAPLNTTDRECQCLWQCSTSSDSQLEASKLLERIISDLVIPKNSTASARRRKICAPDERLSSKGIGYIGVLVMTVVFGTIVLADLKKIFDNLNFAYENFRRLAIISHSVKKFKSLKSSRQRRIH